jgi:hypothetical protein
VDRFAEDVCVGVEVWLAARDSDADVAAALDAMPKIEVWDTTRPRRGRTGVILLQLAGALLLLGLIAAATVAALKTF